MATETARIMRERAAFETAEAELAELPNVKARALRSAERWHQLAALSDRASPGRHQ